MTGLYTRYDTRNSSSRSWQTSTDFAGTPIQRQTPLICGTHVLIGLELELLEVLKAGVLLLEEAVVSELVLGVIPVEEFVQKYRLLL